MSYEGLDLTQLTSFLRKSVLFHEADDEALKVIVSRLEYVRFQKGDPIVLENEISDHVYFVYSGSVEVVKNVPEINQVSRLAILKAGDQFSEFSVLNRSTKGASVFALEDCEMLRMNGDTFLEVLKQLPAVAKRLAIHIAQMSHHHQSSRTNIDYVHSDQVALHPQIPRYLPVQTWKRYEALPIRFEHNSLFVALKNPQNADFYRFMQQSYPQLQVYVSLIGHLDFEALEKELQAGYNDRAALEKARPKPTPAPLAGAITEWLPKIPVFRMLPEDWFAQLADYFTVEEFPAGKRVFSPGEASDKLYFVQSGVVEFAYPVGQTRAAVFLGAASPGDYFGEVSLLNHAPHGLIARAGTDVRLVSLPRDIFDRLLETPYLAVPLACDLALHFQKRAQATSFPLFDEKVGVQTRELANLLPKSLMTQYELLPLRLKDNELTVGITNPESDTIYAVVSRYLQNYRVKLEIIKHADFKKWLAEVSDVKPGTAATVGRPSSANFARNDAVAVLGAILKRGFNDRVSDVHFEPQADCYLVRYRIDGVLHEGTEKYSLQLGTEVIGRIKVLCQIDITNKFTPQDGQLKIDVEGTMQSARVSTLPTKRGEKVVLRLIRQKNSVPPMTTLVPDRRVINLLRSVVGARQGVFLVTGPTGSGKSTTLYSLIRELNRVEVNILSLEDPVEMEIAGTTQVEMNEKTGMTFSVALRSALRQDPNVIMIGEIRDEESAKIAFHAASTGHLVISTLHTNDSLNIIPRLTELGVSRGILASTLIGASAQRLVRQNCSHCVEMRPITDIEADLLRTELRMERVPTELAYGKGCAHCGQTGFHGRVPIIEIWTKTRAVEAMLLKTVDIEELTPVLVKEGFETLRQFALKMVCNKLTTIDEVNRAIGASVHHSEEHVEKLAG